MDDIPDTPEEFLEASDPDNHWGTLGTDVVDTSEFVFESDTDFILVEATDTSFNGTLGTDNIGDYGGSRTSE